MYAENFRELGYKKKEQPCGRPMVIYEVYIWLLDDSPIIYIQYRGLYELCQYWIVNIESNFEKSIMCSHNITVENGNIKTKKVKELN